MGDIGEHRWFRVLGEVRVGEEERGDCGERKLLDAAVNGEKSICH